MRIIAHDKKNNLEWRVNYIDFGRNGKIKHIRGLTTFHGIEDYPIGGHADYVDLDKTVELEVIYDREREVPIRREED